MDFLPDDILELGVAHGVRHRFRLLIRQFLTEFYLDDHLMQCYSISEAVKGAWGWGRSRDGRCSGDSGLGR